MKLWIVDDDAIYHLLMKHLLKLNFPTVETKDFRDGKSALSAISDSAGSPPDIIMLDLNMPNMDGWDFLDKYSKLPNISLSTRIYIVTSSLDRLDVNRASANPHVTDFVTKPVVKETLAQILNIKPKL
jgi:CheY-like chemotaxis protein